jgi:ABC-type lipoprotein export system ATPase subunit
MKIRRLEIRNFRSLREVIMDDLGDLVTIIGKNGSGKTGLIEALRYFFHEFDTNLERAIAVGDASLWYCFDSGSPIEFCLTFDMSADEQEAVAAPALVEMWRSGNDPQALSLTRHIAMTPEGAVWRTMEIRLGEKHLIREGKPTSEPKASEPESESPAMQNVEAEQPPEPAVEPVSIPPSDGQPDGDQVEQVQAEQPQEPPTPQNPGQLSDDMTRLLHSLSQRLRETLSVIPAVRSTPGSAETGFGTRQAFISGEMQKRLVALHDNTANTAAAAKFAELQRLVEEVLDERWRLDFVAGQAYLFEADQRIPIWLTGGGYQEYLDFVQCLLEDDRIFAIEEPESHLHYTLCKALFRLMRRIAKERQIILVTHSEHFLDLKDLSSNWIFEKEGKETKALRGESKEQLLSAITGIGGEPADRLFPNILLLVAGETEEAVVPIWLETVGLQTGLGGVEISPFQGESDWRKAAARIEAYKHTQTRLFLMVDDHGADLAQKAQDLGLPADHCLVLDGTIEDCYPLDKLSDAMEHVFGKLNMRDVHSDFVEEAPRVEEIQRILKERLKIPSKRYTGWKRGLGREVAKRMSEDQIPDKVKNFLVKLAA